MLTTTNSLLYGINKMEYTSKYCEKKTEAKDSAIQLYLLQLNDRDGKKYKLESTVFETFSI